MANESTTCCRGCGLPMASYEQPLADFQIARGDTPNTYVTCETESCPLKGYTFAAKIYAVKDLTDYLKPKAKARRW